MKTFKRLLFLFFLVIVTACSPDPADVEADAEAQGEKVNTARLNQAEGYWKTVDNASFINFEIKGDEVGELIYYQPDGNLVYTFKEENIIDNNIELLIINEVTGKENVEEPYTINVIVEGEKNLTINGIDETVSFVRSDETEYEDHLLYALQLEDLDGYWFNEESESFAQFVIKDGGVGELIYPNPYETVLYTFNELDTEGPEVTISIINSNIDKVEEPYKIIISADDEENIKMIQHGEETRLSRSSEAAYNDYFEIEELAEDDGQSESDMTAAVEEYRQQVWCGRDEDPLYSWDDAYNILASVMGEEDETFFYNGRREVSMADDGRKYYILWAEDTDGQSTAEATIETYEVYDDWNVEVVNYD